MKRIYPDFAYGDGPRKGCWWDETCGMPDRPALKGDRRFDVAIIGGGFTGVSAALHLAQDGMRVAVVENHYVGWGASGRNGGFCCLAAGCSKTQRLNGRLARKGARLGGRPRRMPCNWLQT